MEKMMQYQQINLELSTDSHQVKRIVHWLVSVTLMFLAVPLYVNLKNFSFFIRNIKHDGYLQGGMGGIPFPFFGFIAILIFLGIFVYNGRKILKTLHKIDVIILLFICMFLGAAYLSGYSMASILQLLLFPLLLWAASFFTLGKIVIKFFVLGLSVLAVLHLYSILNLNAWSLIKPFPRHSVYETIFSYQIYQGLISYVNVLTLGAVAVLYLLFKEERVWKSLVLSLSLVIILYLASLSSQRQFAVDLILISGLVLTSFFNKKILAKTKLICLISLVLVWLLSTFLVNNSAGASAPRRLFDTVINVFGLIQDESVIGNVTEPGGEAIVIDESLNRVRHVSKTVSNLRENADSNPLSILFYGSGQVHSGSHNFILDIFNGSGLMGAIGYFGLLLLSFWRFGCLSLSSKKSPEFLCILFLFLMAGAGSMVNAPLTQPFYFLVLLFVAWSIVSSVNESKV